MGWAVWGSNPGGGGFCAPAQTGPEAHLASCPIVPHLFPSSTAARAWC